MLCFHKIRYKIVFNKDYNTDLGLVLAEEEAINQENIYIEKKYNVKEDNDHEKKGFWGSLLGFMQKGRL